MDNILIYSATEDDFCIWQRVLLSLSRPHRGSAILPGAASYHHRRVCRGRRV
jgi:hypothetical protein